MCVCLFLVRFIGIASVGYVQQAFIMLMLFSLNSRRISPTILLDVPRDSMIMNEEIFGPLLPILTVRTQAVHDIEICQSF